MKIHIKEWYKFKYSKLLNVVIGMLFVDIMVDPTNLIFNSKYILFGLVFLIWILKVIQTKIRIAIPPPLLFVLVFIALFMPFYALSVGIINDVLKNSEFGAFVYFNSFFFFLLLIVIVNENIKLIKYINYSALIIVCITLGFYFILLLNPFLFKDIYQYFVIEKGVAVYALREYGEITILQIFYKTSPILVFPLSYYLYNIFIVPEKRRISFKFIILFLIIVTLFLSGTRANILALFVITLFYLGFYIYNKSKKWFVLSCIASAIFVFFVFSSFFSVLLDQHEVSNVVKFGHLTSYFDQFEGHKVMAFFGQGIGGNFYSSGLNGFTGYTELTYLELIRIWGFPVTLVFLSVLAMPVIMDIRSKKIGPVFIAYVAYLFIAGTNPLLLSSTGMIVLVYVFSDPTTSFIDQQKSN